MKNKKEKQKKQSGRQSRPNTSTRFTLINKGLPLIPKDIPLTEQIVMAEKKLKFMDESSSLFISTGEYMMTLASVKRELKELNNALQKQNE